MTDYVILLDREMKAPMKGRIMRDDICREAKELIQRVMEAYVSGKPETIAEVLTYFSPDVLVIGTGRHELYMDLESLTQGMEKDQEEAAGIEFITTELWFEAKKITEDICIVYGEFKAREKPAEGKTVTIDMDTRITASVHREPDGRLVIDSLHQSVPYIYQQEGEYYPKTFADQAEAALKRSAILEKNIQLDPMTGLYNRKYTEQHITRLVSEDGEAGLMLVIDMDDFKTINDTYGHLKGDELLKKVSAVLSGHVPPSAIAGRVGGDEFMVFLPGITSRENGEAQAWSLIEEIDGIFLEMRLNQGCSIGMTLICGDGEGFESAYKKADKALYQAKTGGKNRFCWYGDIAQ